MSFLRRLLRRQDGITLVMAVGILGVLTVSGTTLIYYSSTNARSVSYSTGNANAYDLAEAGINIEYAYASGIDRVPMVGVVIAVADASLSTRCGIDGIPIAAAIARTIGTIGMSAVFFQDMFGLITFDAKFDSAGSLGMSTHWPFIANFQP